MIHSEGPFADIALEDLVGIRYHNAPAVLMRVTKINKHSIEGYDGMHKCKVTIVSPTELRCYCELGPDRQSVLRDVKLERLKGDKL